MYCSKHRHTTCNLMLATVSHERGQVSLIKKSLIFIKIADIKCLFYFFLNKSIKG